MKRRALWASLVPLALVPALIFTRPYRQLQSASAMPSAALQVEVRVNGTALGSALVTQAGLINTGVYLPLKALRRAIDGDGSVTRLKVAHSALYATATGACRDCAFRVNRTVLISPSLRVVDGAVYVPLTDIVRALEGRVSSDATKSVLTIHVGNCAWCILEPTR